MKKLLTLIVAIAMMVSTTNAAFTESKTEVKEKRSAFSSAAQKAAAKFFTSLSRNDYEQLSGHHLSLTERLTFKLTQKRLKNQLKRESETEGFNGLGFFAGFLLGLFGVLGAYIFSKDDNLRKWSWIGLGVSIAVSLIIVLVFLSEIN